MKAGARLALVVSGSLGFFLGAVRFPTWQVAVETAQVLAGRVGYPDGNPFYIYHTKLWTILHQAGALMLRAGMSEIALSKVISGVLGMLSFQAIAMTIFALTRRTWLAIGATVVIFLTAASEGWDVYPVALMGTSDTYGVLGLSFDSC